MANNKNQARNKKRAEKVKVLLDRRKARHRVASATNIDNADVTNEMIEQELVATQCKRIAAYLPEFFDKCRPIATRRSIGDAKKRVAQSLLASLPTQPLKRHVGWLTAQQQDAKSDLSLTEEIALFASYVGLTDTERRARECVLEDLQEAVRVRWEDAEVVAFGSYAAGLSIFCSDVDLAVLSAAAEAHIARLRSELSDEDDDGNGGDFVVAKRPRLSDASADAASLEALRSALQPPVAAELRVQLDEAAADDATEDAEGAVEVAWTIDRSTAAAPLQPPRAGERQLGTVLPSLLGKRSHGADSDGDGGDGSVDIDSLAASDGASDGASDSQSSSSSSRTHTSDLYGVGQRRRALLPARIDPAAKPPGYTRFVDEGGEGDALPLDLDVGAADDDGAGGRRSLPQEALDFANAIDLSALASPPPPLSAQGRSAEATAKRTRARRVVLLRQLSSQLRQLDWTTQLELRHRAKVPIVHLTHRCGVQSDVMLGLNEDDTLRLARAMAACCGPRVLFELSALLKLFLQQLQLDEPFTGGLGSFKLYVLLTAFCQRHPELLGRDRARSPSTISDSDTASDSGADGGGDGDSDAEGGGANTGLLLLRFLQHFGRAAHLNADTVVTLTLPAPPVAPRAASSTEAAAPIASASAVVATSDAIAVRVDFGGNHLVDVVQRAFAAAYAALRDACREKSARRQRGPGAAGGDAAHAASHSFLARLLVSAPALQAARQESAQRAAAYLQQRGDEALRQRRAELLLQYAQLRFSGGPPVGWAQCDAALRVRLRSFVDARRGLIVSSLPPAMARALADAAPPSAAAVVVGDEPRGADEVRALLSGAGTGGGARDAYHSDVNRFRTKKHRSRVAREALSTSSSQASLASLAPPSPAAGFGRHHVSQSPVESLRSLSTQIDATIAQLKAKLRDERQQQPPRGRWRSDGGF